MLKYTGAWLSLSLDKINLISEAIGQGFQLHHTDNETQQIVLSRWMDDNTKSKLPCYNTHNIGVGGLVFNKDDTKILTIKEKAPGFENIWKFPGGLMDPHETIQ